MSNFNRTFNLPFCEKIPNYTEQYLEEVSLFKRIFKFLRRYLVICLNGQKNLELFSILPQHSRILWINFSAPSIGDSLMDLSSRVMLKGKKIDLFTSPKNSHLFINDEIFSEIYDRIGDVNHKNYDLVILDSYSSRSINIKSKILPLTPYVGMYGFFNGPEVNRALFSFYQMNNLLGNFKTIDEVNKIAKNHITISKDDESIVDRLVPKIYISIVLGGEWKYKTYTQWADLIYKIFSENKKINIMLIGSKNGIVEANSLMQKFTDEKLFSLVNTLSFNQTTEVIRRSQVLICCDGGLMHAGKAVGAKIISLLARLDSKMLDTQLDNTISLFDKKDVNNINVDEIYLKFKSNFNSFDNHLQGE
jgi:ADP-heptose:LPS heptosyltransferase